jgi:hypothetical protein
MYWPAALFGIFSGGADAEVVGMSMTIARHGLIDG